MSNIKKSVRRLHRSSIVLGGALGLGFTFLSSEARAQGFADRLSAHVEVGLGAMTSSPQSQSYGLGYNARASADVRLAGPLGLYLLGGVFAWNGREFASENSGAAGARPSAFGSMFGGGLRVDPELSRAWGRVRIEIEAAYSVHGDAGVGRGYFGAGVGWMFPLARVLELGPMVRFGEVIASDAEQASNGGTGNAAFLTIGVSVGLHPPRAAAPRRPAINSDADGDGVTDADDPCPTAPSGQHPDPDRRGCAAGDTDGDGITDDLDRCPDSAEDRDRVADDDGCPDLDFDHDTLIEQDECPHEPETFNGFQDEDGCPDHEPPRAHLRGQHIELTEPISFDANGSVLQPSSFPILDQLVWVIGGRPGTRVRVEGHTDDPGDEAHNLQLSRDRANAVVRYLTEHGIAADRLSVVGYGNSRPVAAGHDEADREINRRIRFFVLNATPVVDDVVVEVPPNDADHPHDDPARVRDDHGHGHRRTHHHGHHATDNGGHHGGHHGHH